MSKQYMPYNIQVSWNGRKYYLVNKDSVLDIDDGCKLFAKMAHGKLRAYTEVPSELLNKYMHERAEIIKCDWAIEQVA